MLITNRFILENKKYIRLWASGECKIKQGGGHDGQWAVFLLKSEKAAIFPVAIT